MKLIDIYKEGRSFGELSFKVKFNKEFLKNLI